MSDMLLRRRQQITDIVPDNNLYIFKHGSGLMGVNGYIKQLYRNAADNLSITSECIRRSQRLTGDMNDHLKIILNKQIVSGYTNICMDVSSDVARSDSRFWGEFTLGGTTTYSFTSSYPWYGYCFNQTVAYATGYIAPAQYAVKSYPRQIVKRPITSYPFYPTLDFCDGDTKIYNIWLE